MNESFETFALVSVTWNQYGWKKVDLDADSKANFSYLKKGGMAHEHLNFEFDKDSGNYVYGYAPAFNRNRRLRNDEGAIIFFISKDHRRNQRKIIGIYGNMKVEKRWDENQPDYKEEGGLYTNIRAEKRYSMLFPEHLDAYKYKKTKRMQQTTIMYIEKDLAQEIISDEISKCSNQNDRAKLYSIFGLVSSNAYYDEKNRALAEKKISEMSARGIRKILTRKNKRKKKGTRTTTTYERDFEMTEAIKKDRGYECQVCQMCILRKNKLPYVEAAHIIPKSEGGNETPDNIMILCPNHHKEFDMGDRNIISHNASKIVAKVNGKTWPVIDLHIRS